MVSTEFSNDSSRVTNSGSVPGCCNLEVLTSISKAVILLMVASAFSIRLVRAAKASLDTGALFVGTASAATGSGSEVVVDMGSGTGSVATTGSAGTGTGSATTSGAGTGSSATGTGSGSGAGAVSCTG